MISDEDMRYLVLGALRAVPTLEQFPLKVREVVDNYDDEGIIQSFTIVTESGRRYTTRVSFDGPP